MGMYAAETLPVLSGLAKGFAVCDGWFASVPTQTFPNRAFAVAGTSLGYTDNSAHGTPTFNTPSVFGKLADAGQTWKIYGYSGEAAHLPRLPRHARARPERGSGLGLRQVPGRRGQRTSPPSPTSSRSGRRTRSVPPAVGQADDEHNCHLENDQHPVSNLAIGEKLLYDVYQALRSRPSLGKDPSYHHLRRARRQLRPRAPADGRDRTGHVIGHSGFDFTRFGVRVPAVLVSPLIPEGTILHASGGGRPPSTTPRSSRPSALVSASERSESATPPLQTWVPSSPCKPRGPTIP